jgi:hypothetical protein
MVCAGIVAAAAAAAAAPGNPAAQFIRQPVLENGVYARSSWIGSDPTVLVAAPTFYSVALGDRLSADAGVIPSAAFTGVDNSAIARVSNTKVRFSYNIGNALLATAGARIPTGFNRLSGEQLATAGNLASRQLNFQYANLFNSLDLCAGLASSVAFPHLGRGDLSVGVAAAFLHKSRFRPSDDLDEFFDPGDETTVSLAAEYAAPLFERQGSLLADIGYTYYGADRFGAAEYVTAGSKFNWAVTAEYGAVGLRVANYRKGMNASRSRYGETSKNANDLVATASAGLPLLPKLKPFVKLGFGSYSGGGIYAAENIKNEAMVGSAGFGGTARLGEHLFFHGETGFDAGTFDHKRLLGAELQAGLSVKF